jgi:ubiquinone/menaquinone biosynthesis C-methylase UbiE
MVVGTPTVRAATHTQPERREKLRDTRVTDDYSLGHSDAELRRLIWQAEILRPYTQRLLELAGLKPGMRVLDVGCGAGDVAMLAAGIVGPSGSVTGIDRSGDPVELAASRAAAAGLPWTRFQRASVEDFTADTPFDAVIGRYVIIHQADPAAFLRAAGRHVAPGGVLAFHEMNIARPSSVVPEVPLWRSADDWAKRALTSVSPHMDAGSKLIEYFAAADLPEPEIWCEAPVGGGPDSFLYKWMADTIRSLLPVLDKLGAPPEVVDTDTLEDRLRQAVTSARAQIEFNPQFLAVAR